MLLFSVHRSTSFSLGIACIRILAHVPVTQDIQHKLHITHREREDNTDTHTHTLSLSLSLSLSHTHTHTHSHSLTHSLARSHTCAEESSRGLTEAPQHSSKHSHAAERLHQSEITFIMTFSREHAVFNTHFTFSVENEDVLSDDRWMLCTLKLLKSSRSSSRCQCVLCMLLQLRPLHDFQNKSPIYNLFVKLKVLVSDRQYRSNAF